MSNTKTLTFNKGLPIGVYVNYITVSRIINFFVSFLVGQAFIFKTINPFVIPYLCVQINRKKGSFAVSIVGAYLGIVLALINIIDIGEFLGMPYFQAYLIQYTVAFILIISSRIIFERSKVKFSQNVKLFISFVTAAASLIVILAFESFGVYYIMLGAYVALASLVIPLFIGEGAYIMTLSIPKNKTKINDKELFSLSLFMTILLIGATRVNLLGISLFLVVLFLYILNLAYLFGGVISGMITLVTVGLFAILTTTIDSNLVLFITFATVCSGFVRKNKHFLVLTFATSLSIIYFLNKQIFFDYNIVTIFSSYVIGSILFVLSPTRFFRDVAILAEPVSDITEVVEISDYEKIVKEFKVQKIVQHLGSLEKFKGIVETIDFTYDCSCIECLSQKEKLRTFKNLIIQSNDISINNYKNLVSEFNDDINFYKNIENNILLKLNVKKRIFKDVKIYKNNFGKYEIVLYSKQYPLLHQERAFVNEVLYNQLNTKFIQMDNISKENNVTKIYFNEKYEFSFSYGIALKTKDDSKVSGDSYSILDLESHETMIALSDGMGAGEKAKTISAMTLDLLDDLLISNVTVDDAIKILNSLLVINSKDEDFATLDLCKINKYTGDCNFYKVGSAQTYILRNGKVRAIESDSLPIGIIEQIDVKMFKFKVQKGDYIVMVTDGISEMDREFMEKDRWLVSVLEKTNLRNPQDLASFILSKSNKIETSSSDDRTVLVCKVY